MTPGAPPTALTAVREFARPRPAVERCDLCAAGLEAAHAHLLDRTTGRLRCSCSTCERLLVTGPWSVVRHRVERLREACVTDEAWQALGVPVDLAFFVVRSAGGLVARYPGAAGTIESSPPPAAWQAIVAANPGLASLEADVEALLVRRAGSRRDYYRVSIDECYRLVGLIRLHWRGFEGGVEVWTAIDAFFSELPA